MFNYKKSPKYRPLKNSVAVCLLLLSLAGARPLQAQSNLPHKIIKYPADKATGVNPDVHLALTFQDSLILHNAGQIRIYDASNNELVDMLDMSIPPGPKNTRTLAPYDSFIYHSTADKLYTVAAPDTSQDHVYQKNFIGGTTAADAFRFYPVILHGNTAIISFHHHRLSYNKTYYVQVDPQVFSIKNGIVPAITGKTGWTFSTKKTPPSLDTSLYVVSTDGKSDFNTVQGAVDFIPENNTSRKTIFIKNGLYDEIVYFRNKTNISFVGEDREMVVLGYANNGVFNIRLMSPDPALSKGSHSLRAVFAAHNSNGIHLINLTLRSVGEKPAQAEALLIQGKENIVSRVNIEGSGDALQATGTIYVADSKIQGYGDNVLGYGAVFFDHCDFVSTFGPHLWVRNTLANHGNVLLNCTLRTIGDVETTIARAPNSNGASYPYVEAVLINCSLEGIRPEGWGKVADVTDSIKYWEFNSINSIDGKPADTSMRHPASRQLYADRDAALINNYKDPAFVLGGWRPVLAPVIFVQPVSVKAQKGQRAIFQINVEAIPQASFQWFKDGKSIDAAMSESFTIDKVKAGDAGEYYVIVKNSAGTIISQKARLAIK